MFSDDLTDGLSQNGLDNYTHLLTGYVGSPSFLKRIAQLVEHMRKINPKLIYVMGDNGHMYVPQELLPIYRDTILPLADIITPNQYEVELLTGKKISSVKDAWDAIGIFHDMKINTVVLSSTELGTEQFLLGLASSIAGGKKTKLSIKIPRFSASFTGTGDLFAALLLSWMFRTENDLKLSLERTIFTLQAVLKRTLRRAAGLSLDGTLNYREVDPRVELAKLGHPDTAARLELQLIQSKADIENPTPSITANIFRRGDVFRLFFHFFLSLFIGGLLLLPDYIGAIEGAPNCVIVCCYILLICAVWG
uniref:Pyridoxal kinase n=1 Tax=Timema shepardi TaxID=629360 RepID=A0A7R9FXV6_TIMSH|nr:unnamed protein product [Timema shepardi]